MKLGIIALIAALQVFTSLESISFAQTPQTQARQKREKALELKTQISDLETQKSEIIQKLTEYRTFVADYDSFLVEHPDQRRWLEEKRDLYDRIDSFERPTQIPISNLASYLTGITGAFLTADGLIGKRKSYVILGVTLLGVVVTVKVAPKVIKSLLEDKVINMEYLERERSPGATALKVETIRSQIIPQLEASLANTEAKLNSTWAELNDIKM